MMRRIILPLLAAALSAACREGERPQPPAVPAGDARLGRLALDRHDCGVCHVIPGIVHSPGQVGPSLKGFARRPHLAGKFPNQPQFVMRWIMDPPAMAPHTAMPAVGVPAAEARDMAAYLFTLQ